MDYRQISVTLDPVELVEFAERVRDGGWSLRAALVRYAQLAPERASAILELIRRTDGALKPYVNDPARAFDESPGLVDVARRLDGAGDILATWARERGKPPHEALDTIAREVFGRLAELGIERESWDGRRGPPAERRG